MAWWIEPLEIADDSGASTGKWRMTAKSDEDGGGPFGRPECFHASPEEAEACEECDAYVSQISGFPSRKVATNLVEVRERAEYERLREKFGEST